jgi:hypothetical protein
MMLCCLIAKNKWEFAIRIDASQPKDWVWHHYTMPLFQWDLLIDQKGLVAHISKIGRFCLLQLYLKDNESGFSIYCCTLNFSANVFIPVVKADILACRAVILITSASVSLPSED